MKKIVALVLSLVMVLGLATVAWAEEPAVNVGTADELIAWAANPSSDLNITANIDLAGKTWTPVTVKNFDVEINGNGYTISNMAVSSGSKAGFIGSVTSGTVTINDLAFDKASVITSGSYAGVVVGHSWYCTINLNDVSVTNSVVKSTASKGTALGGLVGMCNQYESGKINLNGCTVDNCEISGYHSIGGLVGSTKSDAAQNFDACVVTNNTYTAMATGGLGASDYGTGGSGYAVLTTAPGTTNTVANSTFKVADGYEVVQKADGTYYLATAATSGSSTAALFDLHKANSAGTEVKGDIGYVTVPAVVEAAGNGWLEYIKMDGKLFVEIAAADATTSDFYVTKANEKTALFYLSQIDSVDDVQYSAVAAEYTNIGTKCDQLNVPYVMTVAELDFYAVTNPVNGKQTLFVEYDKTAAAGTYAAVAAPYFNGKGFTATAVQLLVDDEVVVAYQIGATEGAALALNQHVFSPVAYDKTTPTKALCGLCGAEAVVYKTGKAPAGSVVIPATFGTDNYDLVITSTGGYVSSVVTPTTDKVQSAETFDAGIAMYVGMSVLAATGSAVVIGKKKD